MDGYIIVNEKLNVWLTAFETKAEAKDCIKRSNKGHIQYKIIKCQSARDWDIFANAMEEKGNMTLAKKGLDKCFKLMKGDK